MCFGTDRNITSTIVWYWAAEGARDLNRLTPFHSRNYDFHELYGDLGEVRYAERKWRDGNFPIAVPGTCGPCGPIEIWEHGYNGPIPPGLPRNIFGLAMCCGGLLALPGQPALGLLPGANFVFVMQRVRAEQEKQEDGEDMPRTFHIEKTLALTSASQEFIWWPVPIGGVVSQLNRLRIACPQSSIPPQQCLDTRINIIAGSSGGIGTSQNNSPLKNDPGDADSVSSGLVQLGNTTANSGGIITASYGGGDYLWSGDEITFPREIIVPMGFAIQVIIGPSSITPSPVPQVRCWIEVTERGGAVAVISPPFLPVIPITPISIMALPAVTSATPNFGCITGGQTVTINGSNFTGASTVNFGVVAAPFSIVSANQIVATSPPEPAGTMDITVTTPNGTSMTSTADQFTVQATPVVTSIFPNGGSPGGGATVTVYGSGFLGASAVNFGSTPATTFTVINSDQILATSPAVSAATVDITVTACGTSTTSPADQYTFSGSTSPINLNDQNWASVTASSSISVTVNAAANSWVTVFFALANPTGSGAVDFPGLTLVTQSSIPSVVACAVFNQFFTSGGPQTITISTVTGVADMAMNVFSLANGQQLFAGSSSWASGSGVVGTQTWPPAAIGPCIICGAVISSNINGGFTIGVNGFNTGYAALVLGSSATGGGSCLTQSINTNPGIVQAFWPNTGQWLAVEWAFY
jgi:hypothetical protein